ncbi:hypothetical protein DV735_g2594, partial [Chaetothyriales sp. CBS 134920]
MTGQSPAMTGQSGSILLAIAMTVVGYLSVLCVTAPNPSPERTSRHQTDRISFFVDATSTLGRWLITSIVTYHALLTVLLPHASAARALLQVCPLRQNTNPDLFTWNTLSVIALLFICIGAYVRLSAYGGLGKYFTFHLAAPEQLVTTGVYGWIQHPSYTGLVLIAIGLLALFVRWDATPACWISEAALLPLHGWGLAALTGFMGLGSLLIATRVVDEENMLKRQFGHKWEHWHRSTKRFIPGIF